MAATRTTNLSRHFSTASRLEFTAVRLADKFSRRYISKWAISFEGNGMINVGKYEPVVLSSITLEHFWVQERFVVELYVWGCGFYLPCVWQYKTMLRVWYDLFYKENLEWMWCLCIVVIGMGVSNQGRSK